MSPHRVPAVYFTATLEVLVKSSLLLSFALLVGCPEPTPEGGVGGAPSIPGGPGGEGGGPGGPGGEAGGAPADGGSPSGAGTFGAELSKEELQPKYTQEELADGSTVKGTLECDECTGSLLVRVLPPPPESGATEPEEKIQLITLKSFESVGDFEIKVPKGGKAVLQVVDDTNSDGQPSVSERMGMLKDGPLDVSADVEGVVLTVGVFPMMPDEGGPGGPGGPGDGGPGGPPGEGGPDGAGGPGGPGEGGEGGAGGPGGPGAGGPDGAGGPGGASSPSSRLKGAEGQLPLEGGPPGAAALGSAPGGAPPAGQPLNEDGTSE